MYQRVNLAPLKSSFVTPQPTTYNGVRHIIFPTIIIIIIRVIDALERILFNFTGKTDKYFWRRRTFRRSSNGYNQT